MESKDAIIFEDLKRIRKLYRKGDVVSEPLLRVDGSKLVVVT